MNTDQMRDMRRLTKRPNNTNHKNTDEQPTNGLSHSRWVDNITSYLHINKMGKLIKQRLLAVYYVSPCIRYYKSMHIKQNYIKIVCNVKISIFCQ